MVKFKGDLSAIAVGRSVGESDMASGLGGVLGDATAKLGLQKNQKK